MKIIQIIKPCPYYGDKEVGSVSKTFKEIADRMIEDGYAKAYIKKRSTTKRAPRKKKVVDGEV